MSEDEVHRFWCILDDEKDPFFIDGSLSWNVETLKDAIQHRRPRLQGIEIVDLVLWKVSLSRHKRLCSLALTAECSHSNT